MYTLLFVSVYFLSVQHLQYQHILLTRVLRRNFKKWTLSGTCTNNGSKIKLSTNRGCITFAWIWGLTGITFAQRKGITIAHKIYLQESSFFFFFYICADCLLFRTELQIIFKSKGWLPPTFENDGYLHISFVLLYSLLQKRLLTCTLWKLCLTQVLFNKRRMQVKCLSLFNLTRLCHVYYGNKML
jgi:hypothetical protein